MRSASIGPEGGAALIYLLEIDEFFGFISGILLRHQTQRASQEDFRYLCVGLRHRKVQRLYW